MLKKRSRRAIEEDESDLSDFIVPDEEVEKEFDNDNYRGVLKRLKQKNYRYKGYDEDEESNLSDMEVGFDVIDEEERRTARIAKKEDAE
jgi:hypothetical protein